MTGLDARLGGFRLSRRSWAHRPGQTLLIVMVSAVISATVIFAVGYSAQAKQAIVDTALAADGPGQVWSLTGPANKTLTDLLPPGSQRFIRMQVAGRAADLPWSPPHSGLVVKGTLRWRSDICAHLVMVSGRCPDQIGEVALSVADSKLYPVRTGDRLLPASIVRGPRLSVSGLYRPRDPSDPYWFGNPPLGLSGFDQADRATSNPLIAVRDQFAPIAYLETLDVQIDHRAIRTSDLHGLAAATQALGDAARGEGVRFVTGVPANLDRIAAEHGRVVSGMALTVVQLGVLLFVVITLLASVTLLEQRGELGLSRLRGEAAARLGRIVVVRWAALITIGWLLGCGSGLAVLSAVGQTLPGHGGLGIGAASIAVSLLAFSLAIATIVPASRSVLAQPVIGLLREVPAVAPDQRGRQLAVDAGLVIIASAGLVVAWQTGGASALGLLVPSGLALAGGVLLARSLAWVAVARRRRLLGGLVRPAWLLTLILLARLRGLKSMLVLTCLAAAFAVFAVQLQVIGAGVRRHQAEVSTGATAVLQVDGEPSAVIAALDQLDPGRGTPSASLTAVVLTRRVDDHALRGMFIEPASFAAIALGASDAAGMTDWAAISAPTLPPIGFTGDVVTAAVAGHAALGKTSTDLGTRRGTTAQLGIDFLTPDGTVRSSVIGQLRLSAQPAQRLRHAVPCQAGCRLLRLTLAPNGPLSGVVQLTSFAAHHVGVDEIVDLGSPAHWQSVPPASSDGRLRVIGGGQGLSLSASSGGGKLAIQHGSVPVVLPTMVGPGVRMETNPTLAAPDGSSISISSMARAADAIPRQLDGVAVADIASVLRAGQGLAGTRTTVEIWVAAAALGRLDVIDRALSERGLHPIRTETVRDALSAQRTSASALTSRVAPGLAVLALGCAALGIGLTIAGGRAVLGRDLAALRLVGVDPRSLRRAAVLAHLGPAVLAVGLGVVAGAVGCSLVIGSLPLLPTAPQAIRTNLSLHRAALGLSALIALATVVSAVVLSVGWLLRSTTTGQLRVTR